MGWDGILERIVGGWLGQGMVGMVGTRDGWDKGWLGQGMVRARDGWDKGWLGQGMVGIRDG